MQVIGHETVRNGFHMESPFSTKKTLTHELDAGWIDEVFQTFEGAHC